jgi:hypothetical protein
MPRDPKLDSLIGQAYDCVLDPQGWGELLGSCARFTGGDTAVLYVKPRASTAGSLLTSRDIDRSYDVSRYLSYYEQRSPLMGFYARQPEGCVGALGDYAFSAAYRETEFFQDWIRPQGFADMLGSHLVRGAQLSAWMSIRRVRTTRSLFHCRNSRGGTSAPPSGTRDQASLQVRNGTQNRRRSSGLA